MKIYLPFENVNDFKCYEIRDKDTIRAYYTTPRNNSSSQYKDFYINSHYLDKQGTATWGNTSILPTCITTNSMTNDFYYRNDFPDILIMFFIISLFVFFIPWKVLCRLFRRFN